MRKDPHVGAKQQYHVTDDRVQLKRPKIRKGGLICIARLIFR